MLRLALLLALALGAGSAGAQAPRGPLAPNQEVDVTLPGPDTLAVSPGGTLGFGVRLDERAGLTRSVRLDIAPPAGWSSLLPPRPMSLRRGGQAVQLVSLSIPRDAHAGNYAVDLHLRGSDGWQESVRRIVRVDGRSSLALEVLDAPRHVVAGQAYAVRMLVANTGNAPTVVALTGRSVIGDAVTVTPAVAPLAAGATMEVRLDVRTQPRITTITDHVRVQALDAGGTRAEAGIAVLVVPRTEGPTRSATWPLTASFSAVTMGDRVTPLLGASGDVALDADGAHRLTLHADGLGPYTESLFAPVPEAWLRYAGPSVQATVGTGTFLLSPGTASSPSGVGGSLHAQLGRWSMTALTRRPLPQRGSSVFFRTQESTDAGVSVGYQATPWSQVSLNALAGTGEIGGSVVTARVQAGAEQTASLDAEGGIVGADARPVYSVRGTATHGRLSVDAEARHREATQPGRLTTLTTQSASARMDLSNGLAAYVNGRRLQVGESRLGVLSPYSDRHAAGGLRWQRRAGDVTLSADLGARHQRYDRGAFIGTGTLDRSTTLAEGSVGAAWGGLRGALRAGRGRTVDHTDGTQMPAWIAAGDLGVTRGTASLTASVSVSEGTSLWDTRLAREWTASLNGTIPVARGVRLDGAFSRGQVEIEPGQGLGTYQNTTARFGATLSLPGGSELLVGAHLYDATLYDASFFRTTLRVPIRLPLPYSVERPRVSGRFVDRATGDGLAGVLVRFGDAHVVTDADGTFSFDATPEGGYLFIDRATLGAGRVPVEAFPLQVQPGAPLRIEVAPATQIRGQLRHYSVLGTGARADTVAADGVPYAVLEASGAGHRVRSVADGEGRFAFSDLPVGMYTIRVMRASLPAGTRLEHETMAVDARGLEEIEWRVLPAERTIRILSGGSLRLGAPADSTSPVLAAAPISSAPSVAEAPVPAPSPARVDRAAALPSAAPAAFRDPIATRARRPHFEVNVPSFGVRMRSETEARPRLSKHHAGDHPK